MTDDRPLVETLENRLMGQGIYLDRWERSADELSLEYEMVTEAPTVTSREVGLVVRALLDAVDERDGWTPVTLRATSRTTEGDVRGTWYVERDWFRALHEELSEVEFSRRVLETIERPDGSH